MEKTNENIAINELADTNEIIFAPKTQNIQTPICNKTVTEELSEDLEIPDYLPEIRRLLRVTPTVPISSKYVNGSLAEFSGNVGWSIMYIGGDGNIATAQFSSPYEVSAEFDQNCDYDADGYFEAFDEIMPESIVGRVTAPRRINVRCRLLHKISAYGERKIETEIYGDASPESIKKLTVTVPVYKVASGSDGLIELEEVFSLPEGAHVLGSYASTMTGEPRSEGDCVVCNGTLFLTLIASAEDGRPYKIEQKVPFDANIDMSLDGDGWSLCSFGKINDISTDVNDSTVLCRVNLSVACEVQKNQPLQITSDIFSTERECEKTVELESLTCGLICGNFNFSHNGSSSIDGLPEGAEIIDAQCSAEPEEIRVENGKYILNGKCRYNVLFAGNGEYSAREVEFPFSCELDEGTANADAFRADLSVNSCRAKQEGENIAYSADISAAVRATGNLEVYAVSRADFGRELDIKRPTFKIVYPSSDETLWEVAKKHYKDPETLAAENGIKYKTISDPSSLKGIKYLII